MQAAMLNYYVGLHEEVLEILKGLEIVTYYLWEDVKAVPVVGEPRMGDHIWPGVNKAMLITFEDEQLQALRQALGEYNQEDRTERITAYVWNLFDVI